MIDYNLDITKKKLEIYYDRKRDDLASEWYDLREKLVASLRSQIKGARKIKIKITYNQIYALLEPHMHFIVFEYFEQMKTNKEKIQKRFFNPDFLINDLFLKIFPVKHFLLRNLKVTIQYFVGVIFLLVCVWARNNTELLYNLGFIISFYGALSIIILTTMSNEQILIEMIQPIWNEKFYIYKNLKGNQNSNIAGVFFLFAGFIIQMSSIYLQKNNAIVPLNQHYFLKETAILKLLIWLLGLLFSVTFGHFVIKWLNFALRKYIKAEKYPVELTPTVGCIERAIYTIFTAIHQYQYIAIFFGIKIAQRLITYTKITNDDELKKAGKHANVFVICNIVSLTFGLLGGVLILYLLKLITN